MTIRAILRRSWSHDEHKVLFATIDQRHEPFWSYNVRGTFRIPIALLTIDQSGGHVADRIGHFNLLHPMILISGILCLAMWLPARHPGLIVVFACLYGLCSGVFISVMPAATGQIIPIENLSALLGAFGSVTSISLLIGMPIAGALVRDDTKEGYQQLIIFSVLLFSVRRRLR